MFNKKVEIVQPYVLQDQALLHESGVRVVRGPIVVEIRLSAPIREFLGVFAPTSDFEFPDALVLGHYNHLALLIRSAHVLGGAITVTTTEPENFPHWIFNGIIYSVQKSEDGNKYLVHPKN